MRNIKHAGDQKKVQHQGIVCIKQSELDRSERSYGICMSTTFRSQGLA
jgi:hypothetical protein